MNLSDYQFYLFDFDGLLVNTEKLHYLAYKKMMADHGMNLTWSFQRYCQSAHYSSDTLRSDLLNEFPGLTNLLWEDLYREKQTHMRQLIQAGAVQLMPGVAAFLKQLQEKEIRHCVVTHSPDELVTLIRQQHPQLTQIPYWITRHQYQQPKPHPESYVLAIKLFSLPNDRIIGFEDTPRGLTALMGTGAEPILVTEISYPEIPDFVKCGVKHFLTFEGLL